jgi:hypothetical protein
VANIIPEAVEIERDGDLAPVALAVTLLVLDLAAIGAFPLPTYRWRLFTPISSALLIVLTTIVIPIAWRILAPRVRQFRS